MKRDFVFLAILSVVLLSGILCLGADEATVPFSFENVQVNRALIALYEGQPGIWQKDQLYLIGLCYVAEEKLDTAQALYEKLRNQDPTNARVLRAIGNIYHMKGASKDAEKLYWTAWHDGHDVLALKQLAALRLQIKDIKGLEVLIDDLIEHQTESLEIQKVLLAYSLMVENLDAGGRVYVAVVHKLSKSTVEQNADLRKLLLMVTARYKSAADAAESNSKSTLEQRQQATNEATSGQRR